MLGVHDNTALPLVRKTTMALQAAIDGATDDEYRDQGASMVEYALLLVLVLLVAFFTVKIFGDSLVALFDTSASTLEGAPNVKPQG